MASIGPGVNLDASVPPLRLTYYDESHADSQDDGNGNFEYDVHKVWATMGRVGANTIMRTGLVEEGDPLNGWPAGHVEENAVGVYANVERWNALTAYNPLGGTAANDFTIYGALAPFPGLLLHLDAALAAQPAFVAEYWNGTVWTALVITTTPDFTQANGKKVQRLEFTLPQSPAWTPTVLGGGVNPGAYCHMRLRLTAGIAVAPAANFAYKDFLYGHFKHFYCHVDLKRGDDTTGTAGTTFRHEGNFALRFRPGSKLDGFRINQVQPVTFGKRYSGSNRSAHGAPWVSMATALGSYRGHRFYGGSMIGRPPHDGLPALSQFLGQSGFGDLADVHIAGYGEVRLGAAGAGGIRLVRRVTVSPNDRSVSSMNTVQGMGIGAGGAAKDVVVIKQEGHAQDYGFRQNVNASARIEGLTITHDDYSIGQVWKSGTGIMDLFDQNWGGPNKKMAPGVMDGSGSQEIREWRRLTFRIREDGTDAAPPAGIPVRITDSTGLVQANTTLDSVGATSFLNLLPNAPTIGDENKNIIAASRWITADGTETLADEPLKIEINPKSMAGYDQAYLSITIYWRFPRAILLDPVAGTFGARDWQRRDGEIALGLPRATVQAEAVPLPAPGTERIFAVASEASSGIFTTEG